MLERETMKGDVLGTYLSRQVLLHIENVEAQTASEKT